MFVLVSWTLDVRLYGLFELLNLWILFRADWENSLTLHHAHFAYFLFFQLIIITCKVQIFLNENPRCVNHKLIIMMMKIMGSSKFS